MLDASDRIKRARKLFKLSQYPEWQAYVDILGEKKGLALLASYSSNDSIEMAKFLGEAKGLDKAKVLIEDEIKLVKRMMEKGEK